MSNIFFLEYFKMNFVVNFLHIILNETFFNEKFPFMRNM